MDTDEMVYVGDSSVLVQGVAATGLVNNALVSNVANVVNPGGGTAWTTKTPAADPRGLQRGLQSAWAAAGYAVLPRRSCCRRRSSATSARRSWRSPARPRPCRSSKYIKENNIVTASTNQPLDIQPASGWWARARAARSAPDGHDRMVVYTQQEKFVRFPMVPLARTPIQYDSIYHKCTYYGRLGVVEVVYPETVAYRDGI
jgi:hypothetical protein